MATTRRNPINLDNENSTLCVSFEASTLSQLQLCFRPVLVVVVDDVSLTGKSDVDGIRALTLVPPRAKPLPFFSFFLPLVTYPSSRRPRMTRSSSKRRLSSFLPRALTPNSLSSSKKTSSSNSPAVAMSSAPPQPFLHLKFTSQRPVPQYGHQLPFAHLVDPSIHDLPDSLKTDVQREGIKRYLLQNFKEGSFVWEVVKERIPDEEEEEGKDSDGMYLVVNRSWTRTVGDNKLHLSLYVYQEDKHCATWHAYTDRTISYSRESESVPADDAVEASDQERNDEENLEEEGFEEQLDEEIPNEDPYSPPSALAQYVASMESRPSSPFEPPERDSERPRFDRPYKEPIIDSDQEEDNKHDKESTAKDHRSRSARKPKSKPKEEDQSVESPEEEKEVKPRERRSRSARREKKPETESESEHDAPKKEENKVKSKKVAEDDKKRSAHPIVKSQPIGHQSSRSMRSKKEEEEEELKSRSPSPVKTRSSRSNKREPSPPKSESESRSRSPSPPPKPLREEDRSPSPVVETKQDRGRRNRRPEKETPPVSPSPTPSRSPSPRPKSRSSRSKLPSSPAQESRSPSPPPVKSRSSRRKRSKSPSRSRSRSPSPVPEPRAPRSRSKVRDRVKEKEEEIVEKIKEKIERSRSRSRSRSPSPPPPRHSRSRSKRIDSKEVEQTKEAERGRSRSVSPEPERMKPRHSRRGRSPPTRSPSPTPPIVEPKSRRRQSISTPPEPIPRSQATPSTEPTWRSVSRNRHRRSDDSDEDTLVRGNMDDHELDIPAGGETTLLKAKPKKRSNSTTMKDEGFDPSEVERARVEREKEKGKAGEQPQTIKSAVGGWFKSVGTFIASEAKLAVGTAEEEVLKAEVAVKEWEEKEHEERIKRKEERARRREERRKRREMKEVEQRKKEVELERMVDRAEDAAEDMMETSERLTRKKERDAKRGKESKHKSREDSDQEEEVSHRHTRKEDSTSTRSRSKHRSSRPRSPEIGEEEEKPTARSSRSTHESRKHHSRREDSLEASESEKEEKSQPRPALRQRAMSISASVDAGLKGLRDSVSKIVSGAKQVNADKDDEHEEQERHREKRKIEKERREIEEERRRLQEEEKRFADRARRSRSDKPNDNEEDSQSSQPRVKQSHPSSSRPLPDDFASESENPAPRSRRSTRRTHDTSDEESEAPCKQQLRSYERRLEAEDSEASIPPVRSRQRQNPPRRSRSESVTSDTDMSDAPSRSSRSVRSMDRSESEADTPAHLEAKRNARRNSTTIPIEQIRLLREQQLNAGTRSIPSSPVSTKPRRKPRMGKNLRRGADESSDDDRFDSSKHNEPALSIPSAQAYPRRPSPVPIVPSPVSPYGRYSPQDPPLRPQPVKPESYRAPLPQQSAPSSSLYTAPASRSYTPVSSGSSDEADPSRPPSLRSRRGYSSGGSIASDAASRQSKSLRDSSPSASYRFPPSDSEPDQPLRRAESFSRTHPSYPFTTDDEEDSEPAPPSRREVKSRSYKDDRFDSTFEESEPESYSRSASTRYDTTPYSSASAPRSAAGGGGGRRTMVSKPDATTRSKPPRTPVDSYATSGYENSRHDVADYPSLSRSTTVDPYYSPRLDSEFSHPSSLPPSFTPSYDDTSRSTLPEQARCASSPPRGFTGFDLRSQPSNSSSSHSRPALSTSASLSHGRRTEREEVKSQGRKGVGRSSVPYGANQAPVSRRTAQRLGVRE